VTGNQEQAKLRILASTQNNGRTSSSNDYVTKKRVSLEKTGRKKRVEKTGQPELSDFQRSAAIGFVNLTNKTVTQSPAPALGVSYDANNHQLGLSYDANGNQMADAQGATSYAWDEENRLAATASNGWPGATT